MNEIDTIDFIRDRLYSLYSFPTYQEAMSIVNDLETEENDCYGDLHKRHLVEFVGNIHLFFNHSI